MPYQRPFSLLAQYILLQHMCTGYTEGYLFCTEQQLDLAYTMQLRKYTLFNTEIFQPIIVN